jgi:hypothetical protein
MTLRGMSQGQIFCSGGSVQNAVTSGKRLATEGLKVLGVESVAENLLQKNSALHHEKKVLRSYSQIFFWIIVVMTILTLFIQKQDANTTGFAGSAKARTPL